MKIAAVPALQQVDELVEPHDPVRPVLLRRDHRHRQDRKLIAENMLLLARPILVPVAERHLAAGKRTHYLGPEAQQRHHSWIDREVCIGDLTLDQLRKSQHLSYTEQ